MKYTPLLILILVLLLVGCDNADTKLQREGCYSKDMVYLGQWEKDITWCSTTNNIGAKKIGFNTRELYTDVLCKDVLYKNEYPNCSDVMVQALKNRHNTTRTDSKLCVENNELWKCEWKTLGNYKCGKHQ